MLVADDIYSLNYLPIDKISMTVAIESLSDIIVATYHSTDTGAICQFLKIIASNMKYHLWFLLFFYNSSTDFILALQYCIDSFAMLCWFTKNNRWGTNYKKRNNWEKTPDNLNLRFVTQKKDLRISLEHLTQKHTCYKCINNNFRIHQPRIS